MNNTNVKRERISRIKPKTSVDMTKKEQRSAIFKLLGVEDDQGDISMLSSSKELLHAIQDMNEQRTNMSKVEWVTHDKLCKNLEKCVALEEKLKQFGLVGSHSPSLFLSKIESGSDSDAKYKTLVKKSREANQNLEAFIDNANGGESIEGKSDAAIAKFKADLQKLISVKENYHYLEATDGFFCYEVLSAYNIHLSNALEELTNSSNTIH